MKRGYANNRGFRRSARRVAPQNHWTVFRGGIRF